MLCHSSPCWTQHLIRFTSVTQAGGAGAIGSTLLCGPHLSAAATPSSPMPFTGLGSSWPAAHCAAAPPLLLG
eukprot:8260257-Pyramimonas_sp.AAC.1